jgi:gluconate 2-dehydrogenase gamma chain
MGKVNRREVLVAMGAATVVPGSAWLAPAAVAQPIPTSRETAPQHSSARAYRFFDAAEARFIEAACERLIPADAFGPGALGAGVPGYLDEHLAGAWGAGEQLYRSGPWQPGTPPNGQPLPFKPAHLFRTALGAIRRDLEERGAPRGTPFSDLAADAQDGYLRSLEAGAANLGVPSAVFFDLLLTMTVEGFFSDPLNGSSRDRVSWRIRGFPGAHAAVLATAGSGSRRQESAGDGP